MIRIAQTENGLVRGLPAADPRITSFKGIPFAAPPTGDNRWRAPQPAANWDGIRDCYEFAPISMQDVPGLGTDIYCKEWHVDPDIPMDEDCLYLNVWTNAKSTDEKLPVLIWFFGGALQWGYPAEMEFDGERIARRGVVVVTVNYRLSLFGFMAHPEITAEAPDAPTNFGNLDQQAGMRWVKRNIAAFGGDPGNVTISGQSAGGGSVMSQIACAQNEGLFQKAVVMSGMIRSPYGDPFMRMYHPLADAEEMGKAFFEYVGAASLAEARKLDAAYLRDKCASFREKYGFWTTVADQKFVCDDPLKVIAENKHLKVQIMSGNTGDEFPCFIPAKDESALKEQTENIFGETAAEFLGFERANVKAGEQGYAPVSGIECTVKNAFLRNRELGNDQNCYYYRFDGTIPGEDQPGTFHSVDLWFFFETLAKCWRPFKGDNYDLARLMCNYYTNFIKTGDPNGLDADGTPMPVWDPYTAENPCSMIFKTEDGPVTVNEEDPFISFLAEHTGKGLLKK